MKMLASDCGNNFEERRNRLVQILFYDPSDDAVVAKKGSEVIGFMCYSPLSKDYLEMGMNYIGGTYVYPNWRKKGVFKGLYNYVLKIFMDCHFDFLDILADYHFIDYKDSGMTFFISYEKENKAMNSFFSKKVSWKAYWTSLRTKKKYEFNVIHHLPMSFSKNQAIKYFKEEVSLDWRGTFIESLQKKYFQKQSINLRSQVMSL